MKNISISLFVFSLALLPFTSSNAQSKDDLTDEEKLNVLCCKIAGGQLVEDDPWECDLPENEKNIELWGLCLEIGILPTSASTDLFSRSR